MGVIFTFFAILAMTLFFAAGMIAAIEWWQKRKGKH